MEKLKSIKSSLTFLDRYALGFLAGFLLVFIPLYPKIPLFEAIPGYIVRVRLEDFVILLTAVVWFIQWRRRRVKVHPLISKLILAYAFIGILSCLSALFVTHTVPLVDIHIFKLFLHYFRRLQYFSLFFIFYSSVKSLAQVKTLLLIFILTAIAVASYGFGQKYFYWPVFSTMNREFSKGWKLYLTEHARVPATFGGHYDAAAYIVVALSLVAALLFFAKGFKLKLLSFIAYAFSLWLLVLTASRTSSLGFVLSLLVISFLSILVKGFRWSFPRYSLLIVFSIVIMLSFGDLSERFSQVLGLNQLKDRYWSTLFSQKAPKPADYDTVSDLSAVTVPSDTPPTPEKPTAPANLPGDVYEHIPIPVPEIDADGNFTGNYINVSRTYSDNAYRYGLSAAIRFDALWPRALAGFKTNPMLGSGYSTLTKESVGQFTEAESTDNEFLRALGETGLLGLISFFGIILAACFLSLKSLPHINDPQIKALILAFIAASAGLLLNALYIDVFTASKVAETYWSLAGLTFAAISLSKASKKPKKSI